MLKIEVSLILKLYQTSQNVESNKSLCNISIVSEATEVDSQLISPMQANTLIKELDAFEDTEGRQSLVEAEVHHVQNS